LSSSLLLGDFAKRVFETEIKEDGPFTRARPNSKRDTDSRNDLQPIFEVVSPADPGAEEERACPFRVVTAYHCLRAGEHGFQHDVKASVRQPDEALAEIVASCSGAITGGILGGG